ncbi:hypothetical protein HD554DRAFT_408434 [Boletus coccyginus]|nr:hypothetical protein HD554DRAFT_408434 [Boletus coccyginus]
MSRAVGPDSICFPQTYGLAYDDPALLTVIPILYNSTTLDLSDSYVPYARRRNTPAQLSALQQLFEATPHPTRAQRQALANEIGMELKSVTNWFQNRRQTSRKKSSSENNPTKARLPHSPARHRNRRSKTPLDRSKISLDRIAELSERPSLTLQLNTSRVPLTPRKSNVQQKNLSSPPELWAHMLSSPAVPPSDPDPDPEEARMAALSSRAKILYPLEWACLKARQKKWFDEDVDRLSTRPVPRHREVDENGAEPEGINLESAPATSLQSGAPGLNRKNGNGLFSRLSMTPQLEDVEAAITLLGFKTHL